MFFVKWAEHQTLQLQSFIMQSYYKSVYYTIHIHAYQLCRISLVNVFRTATTYVYKLEQDKNRPAKLELIFLGEEDV